MKTLRSIKQQGSEPNCVQHSASQRARELQWEAESWVKPSLHLILTMSVKLLISYLAFLSFIFLIGKIVLRPPFLNTNIQRAEKRGLGEHRRRSISSDPGRGLS